MLALGTMLFGSLTDERASFAVLDRYVEAGGDFIDTPGGVSADCGMQQINRWDTG